MTKRPNFFIVGSAKAGTTSLSYYLSSHPEIFIAPIKEPHFFSRADINIEKIRPNVRKRIKSIDIDKYLHEQTGHPLHNYYFEDLETYLKLFSDVKEEKLIGECSTSYLWSPSAASKIHSFAPDSKILAVLRNPVDRAYSHYMMERRLFSKKGSFEEVLTKDMSMGVRSWEVYPMYHELGNYYTQLKRYYDIFPRENIVPVIYDDFKTEREKTVYKIYEFLGVSPFTDVDLSKEFNRGLVPRNEIANWILKKTELKQTLHRNVTDEIRDLIKKIVYTKPAKEALSPELRSKLLNYYKHEIEGLQSLIGRDLSHWFRIE